jgi:hypothetical protein
MPEIAFYAPLKPPTHPVPSGDREMARNLMQALADGPCAVTLASQMRSYDGVGDGDRQARLLAEAKAEAARICATMRARDLRLWVTYHNYYKAPDLLGPTVCRTLGIPYVQIESTRAKSRLTGPWAGFAAAAEAATDAADLVFYLTQLDLITLSRDRTPHQQLVHLAPFLPITTLPPQADCGGADRPMLAAGMMRAGDKTASYRIIADALALLTCPDWRLDIAGDGPERPRIEAMMAPFGSRVRFVGQLDRDVLSAAYAGASLFLWPGVNEAFGLVYLEAQAAGLPVVAQDRPGVRDVLLPADYPEPGQGAQAVAAMIDRLLGDPALRIARGAAARVRVADRHLIGSATDTFWRAVAPLIKDKP